MTSVRDFTPDNTENGMYYTTAPTPGFDMAETPRYESDYGGDVDSVADNHTEVDEEEADDGSDYGFNDDDDDDGSLFGDSNTELGEHDRAPTPVPAAPQGIQLALPTRIVPTNTHACADAEADANVTTTTTTTTTTAAAAAAADNAIEASPESLFPQNFDTDTLGNLDLSGLDFADLLATADQYGLGSSETTTTATTQSGYSGFDSVDPADAFGLELFGLTTPTTERSSTCFSYDAPDAAHEFGLITPASTFPLNQHRVSKKSVRDQKRKIKSMKIALAMAKLELDQMKLERTIQKAVE